MLSSIPKGITVCELFLASISFGSATFNVWLQMLAFIFLFVLFFVVRSILQQAPEVNKALNEGLEFSLDGLAAPHERCDEMTRVLGVPWSSWDPGNWEPENDEASSFAHPTLRSQLHNRFFGPMDMEVAGDQVLIYDMQVGMLHDTQKFQNTQFFQTVISIKPPELGLPPFIVRPKTVFQNEFSTNRQAKTDTALDVLFDVETLTPHRVKALFQSELGTEILVPFLMDHKWTVEWTGDQLIVYELNHLIAPNQLAEVALEASEFFELLKSGPDVVDRMMKSFIELAIAKSQ